jgi:hypothetical protein
MLHLLAWDLSISALRSKDQEKFEKILISGVIEREKEMEELDGEGGASRKIGRIKGRVDFNRVCGVFFL